LHFCGLKIWSVATETIIQEEELEDPEPSEPLATSSGTTVIPETVTF